MRWRVGRKLPNYIDLLDWKQKEKDTKEQNKLPNT